MANLQKKEERNNSVKLLNELELLKILYLEIIIPKKVYEELQILVDLEITTREQLAQDWIKIKDVQSEELVQKFQEELDRGEAEALALAIEIGADYLLIDEKAGRVVARNNQIKILGTIGVLLNGKKAGLVKSVKEKMDNLKKIGFWINKQLYDDVIELEKKL